MIQCVDGLMPNVTPAMVEFADRYQLPKGVLADFDRFFEARKAFGANAWKSFVIFANQYAE